MARLPDGVHIKRVVNYLRRSREDAERERRTGEDTIALQKDLMDRVLREYGLPYDQLIEIGSGERIDTRPVFSQLLREIADDRYNCIAVKEISRLTRGDFRDYGLVYELLRQKRIFILTPYRLYDPKNANDLRQIRFELFLSREEFETIRERMQGAKYAYARSGKFMGSTPALGYTANPSTQRLMIQEPEADIVRLIFELYANGRSAKEMSYRAIATYLTELGIPSPTRRAHWNAQTVKAILQNRVYLGEIRYSTCTSYAARRLAKPAEEWIVVPRAHPPLISDAQFFAVQQKIAERAKPSTPGNRQTSELAGIVRCKRCNRRMVRHVSKGTTSKKNGEKTVRLKEMLICPTKGCACTSYRDVERLLLEALRSIPLPEGGEHWQHFLRTYRARLDDSPQQPLEERRLRYLQQQRKRLQEQLAAIYRNFELGIYSEQEFTHRRQSVEQERQLLEEKLAAQNAASPDEIHQTERHDETTASPPWAPGKEHATLLSLYRSLAYAPAQNRLLRFLIDSASLSVIRKGKRGKPAVLELTISFRPSDLTIARFPL
ncbi:recombinase family protein [Brevibacillus fluminis]|uniref:recombinase family protein n=1 Tax=Brevibacillus fluminis TaxID=511487 RepID=UPI003F8BF830